MPEVPVFLLASERSGSNLIRVIMDRHSAFCAPSPPHLLRTFMPLLSQYGPAGVETNQRRLAADICGILSRQLGEWKADITPKLILQNAGRPTFAGLFSAAYALEAAARSKKRCFIKDNGCIPFALETHACFPNARFVYLVRDARDTVVSWLRSSSHPGGVRQAAQMWKNEQQQALRVYSILHETGRIHLLHYEDLITEPEAVLKDLCEFLDVTFEPELLQFHQGEEAIAGAARLEDWKNLDQPILSGNFGKYRAALTPHKRRLVESITGIEMRQLGYVLDFPLARRRNVLDLLEKSLRACKVLLMLATQGRRGLKEIQTRRRRLQQMQDTASRLAGHDNTWVRPKALDQSATDKPP